MIYFAMRRPIIVSMMPSTYCHVDETYPLNNSLIGIPWYQARLMGIMKPNRANSAPSITKSFPILGTWNVKRPPVMTELPPRAATNISTLKIVARIGDASTAGWIL